MKMPSLSLYRYGKTVNTHDLVKILALLFMVIDHIGFYFYPDTPILRVIGRGAAPLFFFLIGYSNHLRITPLLIIYGVILSIMGFYEYDKFWISILFNFILVQFFLGLFPPAKLTLLWRYAMFILLICLNPLLYNHLEYGTLGILLAYCGKLIALKDPQADVFLILTLTIYFIWETITFSFFNPTALLYAFAGIVLSLCLIMHFYKQRTFHFPQPLILPTLFLSRTSLHLYFYHVVLFKGLATYFAYTPALTI